MKNILKNNYSYTYKRILGFKNVGKDSLCI